MVGAYHPRHQLGGGFQIAIAMVVVSVVASAIAWFLILRANAGSP